ncbi:hypothetical protein BH24ACT22_BH24ACT22_05440 [soil metagenome]
MQDEPRKPRTKVRFSSINFVIHGEDDSPEDNPNSVSVVQQNAMIVNRFRGNQSAEPKDSTEEPS